MVYDCRVDESAVTNILRVKTDIAGNTMTCTYIITTTGAAAANAGDVYTVPYNKEFPCGNMFIARRDAIQQFLSAELTDNDFPAEEGQLSGTLQHYVELIWNYMVTVNKFEYIEIQKK